MISCVVNILIFLLEFHSTSEIQKCLKDIPTLAKELQEIRDESFLHSQLVMATDNMNNIFNINRNLDKAHSLIGEGNLLHAHIVSFHFLLSICISLN